MADSTLVHYSGTFVFYNGDIAEGALLTVYDAGTTNLATIYADAGLTTAASTNGDGAVVADANGLLPFVWIGTQGYKVRLTTADEVLIDEQDNLTGALDLAPFQAGQFASPSTAFTARTANYSMDSDDIGTAISCDPTGGSFTVTLLSAVTVGNGKGVTIDHVGSDNAVSIATSSSQTISFAGEAREQIVLPAYGASVQLVSDGANWHVVGDVNGVTAPFGLGIIRITDRVSSAPTPSAGELYLVSSAYSTFAAGDIIEYNGDDYNVYTPPTDSGWIAYVQDEDTYYSFQGSAWVADGLAPSSSDTRAGLIERADQTEMKSGSATDKAVTPGRQHFHPSMPKAWGRVTSAGSLVSGSYKVSSATRNSEGNYTVTLAITMANTDYIVLATAQSTSSDGERICTVEDHTTTTFRVRIRNSVGTADEAFGFAVFGELA